MFFIEQILPWIISTIGVFCIYHIGHKTPWIFKVKVLNQVLWIIWVLGTHNWGFMPMACVFMVMYVRNHLLWSSSS